MFCGFTLVVGASSSAPLFAQTESGQSEKLKEEKIQGEEGPQVVGTPSRSREPQIPGASSARLSPDHQSSLGAGIQFRLSKPSRAKKKKSQPSAEDLKGVPTPPEVKYEKGAPSP